MTQSRDQTSTSDKKERPKLRKILKKSRESVECSPLCLCACTAYPTEPFPLHPLFNDRRISKVSSSGRIVHRGDAAFESSYLDKATVEGKSAGF